MFGYACRETPELMPAPILLRAQDPAAASPRRGASGDEPALGPDAKSQVTVRYEDGMPIGVDSIVLSTQHLDATLESDDIRASSSPMSAQALPDGWLTNGRRSGTSIRPASSSSADRTATAA